MITLYGQSIKFLIDTGANTTIINPSVYDELPNLQRPTLQPVKLNMVLADGTPMMSTGKGEFDLKIGDKIVSHEVWVADIDVEGILGTDFLLKHQCLLNMAENDLLMKEMPTENILPDVFEESCCRVAVKEDTTIPANSESVIGGNWLDKPSSPAEGILEPTYNFTQKNKLMIARILTTTENEHVALRVVNLTDEPIKLYRNTVAAEFEPIEKVVEFETEGVCRKVTGDVCDFPVNDAPETTNSNTDEDDSTSQTSLPSYLQEMWKTSSEHLQEDEKEELLHLLHQNKGLFAKSKEDLGRTSIVKHHIDVGTARPIKQRPRRLAIHQREEEQRQIEAMLRMDVIEESNSPWSSPVCMVLKKDKKSWRFCIDYRLVNQRTLKDSYALPRIDDSLDMLAGAKWFSTLDLSSGYWQVELDPESRPISAFVTSHGLYQWKVMSFGLCNAPATFERLIEKILVGLQWKTCLCYLDDVVVYSSTFPQAVERLQEVFDRMKTAGLKLNPSKCKLFQKSVEYLGHIVSEEGVSTDPAKVEAVQQWPTPRSVKDIRSFLGLCSY